LKAAHLLQHKFKGDPNIRNFLPYFGIVSINSTMNGMSLCNDCHTPFDAGLWCINPKDDCIIVADALLLFRPPNKWSDLNGEKIIPKALEWPTKQLFEYRLDFMKKMSEKRNTISKKFSYHCCICYRHYQREKHNCKPDRKIGMSDIFTPQKLNDKVKDNDKYDEDDDNECYDEQDHELVDEVIKAIFEALWIRKN
jgi:hypothetical protein